MNLEEFIIRLRNKKAPVILDGAIGSLIQQKGIKSDKDLWVSYINFRKPELIQSIHEEYINAGAEIITSNTFRTNPLALQRSNMDLDVEKAVGISLKHSRVIADKYNVLLAGSNAPAEDCYQQERTVGQNVLIHNHHKHISQLYENGSDFILNETQSHMDEIEIICKFCKQNNIPFIISLYVQDDMRILSGESLKDVIKFILNFSPIAILFNCISEPALNTISFNIQFDFNWGFYINCGSGNLTDENISCGIDEFKYADIVKSYLSLRPSIIGACCGSNPNHIKALRDLLNE